MQTNIPEKRYPIQTQSHDCHHDKPSMIMAEEIIHVLILKESAIQKATKFQEPHCRRSGSTGCQTSAQCSLIVLHGMPGLRTHMPQPGAYLRLGHCTNAIALQ